MGWTGTALFSIAQADVGVLLDDLDPNESSPLYAWLFKQLTAGLDVYPRTELQVAEDHAEAFRRWLDRAKIRHTKSGASQKAQAFGRVRKSER
jgi:hypothetical protein